MKKLLLSTLLLLSISIYSQKEANIWYFGANAGLDFNTTPPTALTNGNINTLEGCSSFSDANGNLLFYSDGITVYDKNHQIMKYSNGNLANNLKGNPSSTQSGMIIPKPGSTSIYYLFTVGDGNNPAFDYYVIDMSLNSGAGQLINETGSGFVTNLTGGRGNWTEKVAAVRGKECNTYWVVSIVGNDFYAYKVTNTGVSSTPIISSVTNFASSRGYLKLSPDGSKLAIANQSNDAFLYSFNNETGQVQNDGISLISNTFTDGQPYGVEFSADSKKLYISTVSGFRSSMSDPATTYKLFQFDLTSANITNSKTVIHTQSPTNTVQGGFRGALQLGPDSKIYATIPVTYSDPSGFAEFLDVIENPSDNAADIIFTKNAINLNGRKATQGLPPFIASLLLPIEIKDQISSEVVNNQTLQFCIGSSKTIAPDPVTGNNVKYLWTFNNGTTTTTVSNVINLTINNMTLANAGTYNLKVTLADNCGNKVVQQATFKLEVYQPAKAKQPNNIFYCDLDNDGFNTFDLSDTTTFILNGQDPAIFEVVYYLSQADADNNTTANAIANPYTNPTAFSSQTIYARMHNKAAPNACYDITTFTLAVTGKPIPSQPKPYEVCDDDIPLGGDTDGVFNSFFLNTKDAEILDGLNHDLYEVSYHTTLQGAQTDKNTDVIDKIKPYKNTKINSQEIFVRVENINNAACNDTSISFFLVVNPLPVIANPVVTLKQCDTDADLNTTINLTLAEISISNNSAKETFKYYPTRNDAINDTAEITNNSAHPVTNGDKIWVRTISDKLCYRISEIDIVVGFASDITYGRSFELCDDFLDIDGNDNANNNDTDGITTFDLSEVEADIKNQFPAANRPNLDVLVFETIADRDAVQRAIPDLANYRNKNVPAKTTQTLYIKVIDKTNNDCQGLSSFTILAQQPPIANDVEDIKQCDDFASTSFDDGINEGINLRDKVNDILGSSQAISDYTVTFHTKPEDANTGANPIPNGTDPSNALIINDTNYTNQTRDRETIYVRVVNNTTGCFNDHLKFDIIINPLPTINVDIPDLEVCDDGNDGSSINGLAQNIKLSLSDSFIIKKLNNNVNGYTISYHKTRQQAIDGTSAVDKNKYSNDPTRSIPPVGTAIDAPHTEVLYVSILNNDTQCRYGLATLTINTYPEPTLPDFISNYEACDNTSDTANSDTNGINGDISLNTKISEILANYPTAEHSNFTITFHDDLPDAQAGNDPINQDKYQNTTNNQPIYVRVVNKTTSCVNDNLSFNIVINPLPSFTINAPNPNFVCLDNPTVTTDNVGATLTINAVNTNNYTYNWTLKNDSNSLGTDPFLRITRGGIYVVTATMKDGTGCERSREVTINESISPTLKDDDIVIIDDTNNSGLDNYSIKIITENKNLGIGDYQFALQYLDDNGFNVQTPFQDEPLFENIFGGFYTVIVNDKNGCNPNAKLEVSVIQYPKFLTPNGDGKNDTWKIKGANSSFYPASNITVVNRHGKIVAIIPIDSPGWNGTYNGKVLPSNDYWFRIQLIDRKGKIHQHQGHFALIRR